MDSVINYEIINTPLNLPQPIFNRAIKFILSVGISIIFFYYLKNNIDFKALKTAIHKMNIFYLAIAVISLYISYIFRALRINLTTSTTFFVSFSIANIHNFLNRILPARLGELFLPALLKKYHQTSFLNGIGLLLLFRYIDFTIIFGFFLISSLLLHIDFQYRVWVILFILSIFTILVIFLIKRNYFISISEKLINNRRFRQKTSGKLEKISNSILALKTHKIFQNRTIKQISILTILNWIFIYLFYFFIIKGFGFNFNFIEIVFACTFSNLTFLIPISLIGNIGFFELGWALGFIILGFQKDETLAIGLFSNIFATLCNMLSAGILFIALNQSIKKHAQ